MTAATGAFFARMTRARAYIDTHLDEPLDLDRLSAVAAFSRHHFHRQFTALFGVSVARYAQLARLKRAAFHLAYRNQSITEIALDAGYETPESSARAFRQQSGQAPSAFRQAPDWERWHQALAPLAQARNRVLNRSFSASMVTIRDMPTVEIAIMMHRGDPARLVETIQRFIAWRRANDLTLPLSPTYTIFHDDPHDMPPEEYRVGLCAGLTHAVTEGIADVTISAIPAGRRAVLRINGNIDTLEDAAGFLYRDWLPASGEKPDDFPLYCQRLKVFPQVAETQSVAELFLPLSSTAN